VTLRDAIASGNWDAGNFNILTPFLDMSKAQIVQLAAELKVDLANTWSCYEGDGDAHCGKCGTCVERREAFVLAGVEDPTIYAS
jgi:7-cyano-7-deazaguanine synthase